MAKKIISYISASQVTTFLTCPLAYKYIYVDGADQMPPNIYMSYGTAMHEALAHNYKQKIKSRKDLPVEEIIKVFETKFTKEVNEHGLYAGAYSDTPATMTMTAQNVLHKYMEEVAPKIQPIMVEERFELKLKNYPIIIVGYMDVVTEDGWVIDHKTAGKSWKSTWTQKKVDDSLQGTFYSIAYRKMFGKQEAGFRIDVIPRINVPTFPVFRSFRTEAQVKHLLELCTKIEKIVELGVFAVNPDACGRCGFKPTCPKLPVTPFS